MQKTDLTITGTQTDGTNRDSITQNMTGTFAQVSNSFCLKYKELSEDEQIIQTRITIHPNRVQIDKSGAISSRMELIPDTQTQTEYATPYGTLPLDIATEQLSFERTDTSFTLKAVYRLYYGDTYLSTNTIHINGSLQ